MLIEKLLRPKIILIIICLIFILTRIYKISEIPVSVYWDEASIGYNAYSVIQTGKDEWGNALPIHFRAFGEFKLPVYIYTVAGFVNLFGLNELTVRIPAVLYSLGVVILTYLLAKQLFSNIKIALLSSFIISISPWLFIFSRTGYEATSGLAFYLLAIYLFIKKDKSYWYILFSILSFILSAYSYNSFRVITPLTILILVIYKIRFLLKSWEHSILPILISVIVLFFSIIPIYRLYKYDAGVVRLQAVSANNGTMVKNYLSHFSLSFLFLKGDGNPRSQQPGFGQLYWLELILLPLGLIFLIKNRTKYKLLLLFFLLLGPIPAAITKESPHALRSLSMVPFLSMISASGVIALGQIVKKENIIYVLSIITFIFLFINYVLNFINIYPNQSSQDWQYGYKEIFTNDYNFHKYKRILVSDEYAQPYIFALFYQQINPSIFRNNVVRNNIDQWGFSTVASFNGFQYGKIDKMISSKLGNSLIFASDKDKRQNKKIVGEIKFLDGKTAFLVYED